MNLLRITLYSISKWLIYSRSRYTQYKNEYTTQDPVILKLKMAILLTTTLYSIQNDCPTQEHVKLNLGIPRIHYN